MPLDANVVANELITRGQRDDVSIDPMKLQKLLYLAHGWHLAFLDSPLIGQEIEAWKYGPVIPPVYREFKEFKGGAITRFAPVSADDIPPSDDQKGLIEAVWNRYREKSGIFLSMLTHEPGSAWEITRRESPWFSPVIPNELIREEFARKRAAGRA